MGAAELLALAVQFGPVGLFAGYVVWDKTRIDAKWRDHEERRIKVDESKIETDNKVALALQALTIAIGAMGGKR